MDRRVRKSKVSRFLETIQKELQNWGRGWWWECAEWFQFYVFETPVRHASEDVQTDGQESGAQQRGLDWKYKPESAPFKSGSLGSRL